MAVGVVIHLEGKASLWHQNFMKKCNNILPTWEKYKEEIHLRFGELYDDPMAELKALKQQGSVQEYHDMFDALASCLQLLEEYLQLLFGWFRRRNSVGRKNVLSKICSAGLVSGKTSRGSSKS